MTLTFDLYDIALYTKLASVGLTAAVPELVMVRKVVTGRWTD